MNDYFHYFLLEDLETLESIKRGSVFIPVYQNNDLDELDEDDFRRIYRFYKGPIETLIKLLLTNISQPSRSRAITDVARALPELRPQYIYLPQTEDDRMQISQKFYREFGFPGIYDALDCSLIKILNPGGSLAEAFRCRKGFFALSVQTVSDPNLSIGSIVVRGPGSTHDSTVFDPSYLRAHVETEVPSSYHLLGDSGYPL
ncbi:nuclease HARBI1 [Trichonephila clavipes]|nr:nuclease HARBI1 [Trichonephila clavipes]